MCRMLQNELLEGEECQMLQKNEKIILSLQWRLQKKSRKWYDWIMPVIAIVLWGLTFFNIDMLKANEQMNDITIAFCILIGITVLAFVRIKFHSIIERILKVILFIGIPFLCMYLIEFCNDNTVFGLSQAIIWMNYGCYMAVLVLFFGLTGRVKGAYIGTLLFCAIYGLANKFILLFRGTPIVPWDLYSLRTAVSVAGNYEYSIDGAMLITILAFVLAIFFVLQFSHVRVTKKRYGISFATSMIALVVTYVALVPTEQLELWGVSRNLWKQENAIQENGVWLNFVDNTKDIALKKPEGYNKKEQEEIFDQYETKELTKKQKKNRPTIIAIMDESFCDMTSWVEEGTMEVNKEPIPFTTSWKKNVIRGDMLVPVFGAGTATTEFEFLTGQSQAFYPSGSVAYQQFIHDETQSLASILKSYGYKTLAMHPYYGNGWSREKVYPLLGFDDFLSIEDLKHQEMIRYYCSDASNYENIIEEYENRGDDPLFIFNVTMQNHGGYVGDMTNFTHTIKEKKLSEGIVDEYLSLTYESDQALKDLVKYFSKQEDPVVICFFGDHWPKIQTSIYDRMFPDVDEFERTVRQHTVPFYVWANYDIDARDVGYTSTNYISGFVLEAANLPLDPWHQFLEEMQEKLPAISTVAYVDEDQEIHSMDEESEENEAILELERAQYYYFQDRK